LRLVSIVFELVHTYEQILEFIQAHFGSNPNLGKNELDYELPKSAHKCVPTKIHLSCRGQNTILGNLSRF
jgi:hypothetical protein